MPPDKRITVNAEYSIAAIKVGTVSGTDVILVGYMDYAIIVTDPKTARTLYNTSRFLFLFLLPRVIVRLLLYPSIEEVTESTDSIMGFFIVESKAANVTLFDCIPQVVSQMYASAKKLKCASPLPTKHPS